MQHAHQKGIIHRDLKPSNVLIALYDGKPVPKVIDFGVAKATGPRLTDQTLYTEFGAVVGTLEYMSPEQAELNQLDIDTRSDIYSLGVLLYELLTGSTPLERKRLKQVVDSRDAAGDPRGGVAAAEPAADRRPRSCRRSRPAGSIEPRKLSGLVRGELDWIVMKALEKDRNRRYETANGLAADLRRYLDDEPVQACPPTAAYRLSKFAKKYRVALATACAFVAVLIGASVISLWQAVRANRARAEAVLAYAAETEQRREAQDQRDRALKAEGEAQGQPGPRPRRRRRLPDDDQREPAAQVAFARPAASSQRAAGHGPEILRGLREPASGRPRPASRPGRGPRFASVRSPTRSARRKRP